MTIPPLSAMVNDSMKLCDPEIRKELCSNLLVVGGGALFNGLTKRLSNELASMIPMVRHTPPPPPPRVYVLTKSCIVI
jgi:actin-related protein